MDLGDAASGGLERAEVGDIAWGGTCTCDTGTGREPVGEDCGEGDPAAAWFGTIVGLCTGEVGDACGVV